MSNLSPQEITAGISRAALETLKRQGKNGDSPYPAPRKIGDGVRETSVIDTPYWKVSIIESGDGVILRSASFVGSKCDVALIHLDYEQTRTLGAKLVALREPADSGPDTSKPSKRVRP